MKALRRAARAFGDTFGRRSLVVTALRPMYDAVLSWSSAGRGIEQTLNGRETVRVDPRYRVHFPDRYEPEVCQYLRDNVRAGSVAMNVGAHVGVCALCLAQWAGPRGKVFAFEPNPFTRDVLVRHVAMNGFDDRIQVVDEAISDHVGTQAFFAGAPELNGTSGFSRLGKPNPELSSATSVAMEVPITTLDTFSASRDLAPDWLIIDVEGYEAAVLTGARTMITSGCGRLGIIVEMDPSAWTLSGTSRPAIERLLRELGLCAVSLTGQRDPLGEYGVVRLAWE